MERTLTLCLRCAEKYARAYRLERTEKAPGNGKCDQCHKKLYVAEYEVMKK